MKLSLWSVGFLLGGMFLLLTSTLAVSAPTQPPSIDEQVALFADVQSRTFPIPKEPAVPALGDFCWQETARWKRLGLFMLDENGKPSSALQPGLRKLLVTYDRRPDARCALGGPKTAVFEQTFHSTGPVTGRWWAEGLTFHSRYLFAGARRLGFYREHCRPFGHHYLVCRVINVDADEKPGFVALLSYERF